MGGSQPFLMPGPIYDRDYGVRTSLLSELPYFLSDLAVQKAKGDWWSAASLARPSR